jgi:hypothetical protein
MLPIVAALLKMGLPMLGNAILNKGQEVVEEKLGVKLPSIAEISNPDVALKLKQLESDHEEFLMTQALENRKLDLQEYGMQIADVGNARAREVSIVQASAANPWLVFFNFQNWLTLVVVIGAGWVLVNAGDIDIRLAANSVLMLVLGYYYGTTKNSHFKDETINKLSKGE